MVSETDPLPASEKDYDALLADHVALKAEHADLQLLYEATIEHGEAVEDQLAESNLELRRAQRRLDSELEDAARYVMSILPPTRDTVPVTEWRMVPSTELGGDSFGYHDIDDDHVAFYLLDVCGHGVGAALLSVTVINVLRASALARADFKDPGSVLGALNDAFPMEKQNNMFFTIWYGVWQRSSGHLTYASGGHPPALHLSPGASGGPSDVVLLANPGGMAIGAIDDVEYGTGSADLRPGDRVILVSDGTFEIDTQVEDEMSIFRLAEFAAEDDSVDGLYDRVRALSRPGPLPDDFSILRLAF